MKTCGEYAYEYSDEYECYVVYIWDGRWEESGHSFETEWDAIEYCEGHAA